MTHQATCCELTEFACDGATAEEDLCCNTGGEKCCVDFCLDAAFCCAELEGECGPSGHCCETGQQCSQCCEDSHCGECRICNQGVCDPFCEEGLSCCPIIGAAPVCVTGDECCGVLDCVAPADTCLVISCDDGFCNTTTIACLDCEACDTGVCVSDCPDGQTCCPSGCEDLLNDPTNCGDCAAECSAELVMLRGRVRGVLWRRRLRPMPDLQRQRVCAGGL